MQELLPELEQTILLYLDCNSLLEYWCVNRQAQKTVQEIVPLLCVRDGFESTNKLYAWALLISGQQETRYSHLFGDVKNDLDWQSQILDATRRRDEKVLTDTFDSISQDMGVPDKYLHLSLREVLADPNCTEWLIKNKDLYVTPHGGWDMTPINPSRREVDKLEEEQFLQVVLGSHRADLLPLLYPNKAEILEKISSLATVSDYYNLACNCQLTKIDQLSIRVEQWISKHDPKMLLLCALREGNLVVAEYIYNTFLREDVVFCVECLRACCDANTFLWLVNVFIERGSSKKANKNATLDGNPDVLDPVLVLDVAVQLPDCHPKLIEFLCEKFAYTTVSYKQVLTLLEKGKFACLVILLDLPLDTKIISRDKNPNLGQNLLLRCFYPHIFTPTVITLGYMYPFLRVKDLKETLRFFGSNIDYKIVIPFYLNECELVKDIITLLLEQSYKTNDFSGGLPEYWQNNFPYDRDEQLLAQLPYEIGMEMFSQAEWDHVLQEAW